MVSHGKFVAYYRVSTLKQGKSGVGVEGQRRAVETYLNGGRWKVIQELPRLRVAGAPIVPS
jgi:DNA invertase Pin-like site-specific DNA recombinase